MNRSYFDTLTESEESWQNDHSVTDAEEEAYQKVLERLAIEAAQLNTARALKAKRELEARMLICSCGHHTCPLVSRYGLPTPIFSEDIKPLYPQSKRDQRALEIKGTL